MICPHCLVSFHDKWISTFKDSDKEGLKVLQYTVCSACERFVIRLNSTDKPSRMVYPKGVSRAPVSKYVPEKFSEDYKEACLVLSDSPKASAALSRRCLQLILRDVANVKPQNLNKEIDELLKSKVLPTHIAEAIDAIRNIGNFAAHPLKSTSSGEVLPVEPGEAEWSLDVLEGLFDFYFVQPATLKVKKAALDQKLATAGKPPMK